jgi:cardiolipin synthase
MPWPDLPLIELGVREILLFLAVLVVQLAFVARVLLRQLQYQSSSMAWIVLILALPGVGIALYLLMGEVRLGRRTIRRHREIQRLVRRRFESVLASPRAAPLPEEFQPLADLGTRVGGMEVRDGNRTSLFSDSEAAIDAMVADIDRAISHCHLLTYIYLVDGTGRKTAAALERASRRGVACRLLVDARGSKQFLRSGLRGNLEAAGVEVAAALPVSLWRQGLARIDVRNHRKATILDGRVAYTGSQNVADAAFAIKPRFAPWVDVTVRLEGPVVRDLQALFVEDWYLARNESLEAVLEVEPPRREDGVPVQVLGSGPNSHYEALEQLVQATLHTARRRVVLTTPYYVPDEGTNSALRTVASRGVDTTLVVPARNDSPLVALASRSFYGELLEAGVAIYEFSGGLLHAKTMTLDGALAQVMTANMDRRSFEINFELSLLVYHSGFTREMLRVQEAYIADSDRVDRRRWEERPWPRRALENAAGLVSPLL